jgi:hypothetical protein
VRERLDRIVHTVLSSFDVSRDSLRIPTYAERAVSHAEELPTHSLPLAPDGSGTSCRA